MLSDKFDNKVGLGKERKRGNFGFETVPEFNSEGSIELLSLSSLSPAPDEWNFYSPLNDGKMTELVESISKNGILNPIIVWEQNDNTSNPKYMILSGHNRKRAYEILKGIEGNDKYDKIPALIKYKDDITEEDAREIIIDTNWVQRELSQMERAKSVIEKYAVLQSKTRYGDGKSRDILAEDFNITGRQIDNYRRLENIIDEIHELVIQNKVTITPAYELARIDKEMQMWVFQNHKDKIKSSYTRRLKTDMTFDQVINIFEGTNNPKEKLSLIKLKLPLEVCRLYESLSKQKQLDIEKEFLYLLNKYK